MLTHTQVISRKTVKRWGIKQELVHSVTYRLSPTPFRLYSRWELPQNHEIEDWETDDDSWIKRNGMFYNLNEFLRIGMPHLPGPMGGAQLAAGDFLIAAFQGEVYSVSTTESRPI
jgi:hypothetical protein